MPRLRIRYLSDLHLEFTDHKPDSLPSIGEDFVVLAGDISEGLSGLAWAEQVLKDRPVIYVLGNHEFFGKNFTQFVREARAYAASGNVRLLECEETEVGGLRILGCSLWTDFLLYGHEARDDLMRLATHYMPDYEEIRGASGNGLIARETMERCEHSAAWLDRALQGAPRPTLVVTHHAPSEVTANPAYTGELSNAAFHSHLDRLVRPPCVAWIHGHSHHTAETRVNGIPLVTNQRGYPDEASPGFSWDRILEIDLP